MTAKAPYTHFEHRHRFAAWAAARAAQRGFARVAVLRQALEACGIVEFVGTRCAEPISAKQFEALHREWCRCILADLLAQKLPKATFGRAAKLVAVYLKAMVVVGCDHTCDLARVAHPPIDRLLLQNLTRVQDLSAERQREWSHINWTALDEDAYYRLVNDLRTCVGAGEPFWLLERYWTVSA